MSAIAAAQRRYDARSPYDLSAADSAEEAADERRWLAPLRTLRVNARRSVRVDRDATGKLTFATLPATPRLPSGQVPLAGDAGTHQTLEKR